jgi:trk system potassium uptake protein
MIDVRPAGYLIGWLVGAYGASMALPAAADWVAGDPHWRVFAMSGMVTMIAGGLAAIACADGGRAGLGIRQSFLLTTAVWALFPVFGALPFVIGAPGASFTDAYFEAMSGLTTTGSTVFTGLELLPPGTLLWRGLLQWFGGIGIVIVAMVFLPTLRVGGMQLFRSEAFDTLGKILPRAGEIAASVTYVYLSLTLFCFMMFMWSGLGSFDALVHAMTTVSTGGFSNYDASFGALPPAAEYVASLFMVLASLPFVRYVQLLAGSGRPMLRDSQIRYFLAIVAVFTALTAAYVLVHHAVAPEQAFREALFNVISIGTGTGFASVDYAAWGGFAVVTFFVLGLIGGCSGSTTCSVKVFRYQLVLAAINDQIRQLHNPHRVFTLRYQGRRVPEEVLNSVIAFFMMFYLTLGVLAVLLVMLGLTPITAISAAATALANVGPGLGPEIGPAGNFAALPDRAKWVLSAAMLIGRLELLSVYVLFTAAFWRP